MNERELTDLGGGTIGGLLARRAAALPDKLAVITDHAEMTYGQLDEVASQVAAGLGAQGVEPGDAVAIFMSNRLEWITSYFGILRGGMASVPVNTAYKGSFLTHGLLLSGTKAVFVETALLPALAGVLDQLPDLRTIVLVGEEVATLQLPAAIRVVGYRALLAVGEEPETPAEVKPSDSAGILLTSGTTGKSKGVVVSHLMCLVAARENLECLGTHSRDRLYTCLPMFHGAAQLNICLHSLYAGSTFILAERFSASGFWNSMREHRVTMFNALGSVLPSLLAQPKSDRDRDHSVRTVFAAPAPPEVLLPFEDRFNLHIVEGYGLTEIKNVCYNPIAMRRVGSIGRPTRTTELQIQDEHGEELPPGVVGEIVYRPRAANIMFSHYIGDPAATLSTIRGLWWCTGDMGYMDSDGYFYFIDRMKDALRRRGENISSYEVEAVLSSFPAVGEVAAVATPSELGEDEVLAVFEVESPEGFDFEGLFRHCDERLPHFMVPRYFRPVLELPRTPTGKIRKAILREHGRDDGTWDALQAGHTPTRQV